MATNNMNNGIKPEALGQNYGQLAIFAGVAAVIALLAIASTWYGYYYYPLNQVLGGDEAQPLVEQVPLDIMPALPGTLEEAYDIYTANAYAEIGEVEQGLGWLYSMEDQAAGVAPPEGITFSYEVVDEENGIVRIPFEDAQSILLENDGFPVRDNAPAERSAN